MRLGVITDEISGDLAHALDVVQELELDAVELRTVGGVPVTALAHDELRGIRSDLDARGLPVCAVASPFLKCGRDDTAGQDEVHRRALAAAAILGAPLVRAFSFWREPNPAVTFFELGEALRPAVALAEAAGVLVALENEHDCNAGSAAEARGALDAAAAPGLGLIWDPGNAAMLDPAAFHGLGGLELLYDEVVHVHVKDVDGGRNWCRIGDGVVDFAALVRFLREHDYGGVVSFETHYQRDGSGEAATRDCVAAFRELL